MANDKYWFFYQYIDKLIAKLDSAYLAGYSHNELRELRTWTYVSFKIQKSGKISDIRLSSQSTDSKLNERALHVVTNLTESPMEPLPSYLDRDSVSCEVAFGPGIRLLHPYVEGGSGYLRKEFPELFPNHKGPIESEEEDQVDKFVLTAENTANGLWGLAYENLACELLPWLKKGTIEDDNELGPVAVTFRLYADQKIENISLQTKSKLSKINKAVIEAVKKLPEQPEFAFKSGLPHGCKSLELKFNFFSPVAKTNNEMRDIRSIDESRRSLTAIDLEETRRQEEFAVIQKDSACVLDLQKIANEHIQQGERQRQYDTETKPRFDQFSEYVSRLANDLGKSFSYMLEAVVGETVRFGMAKPLVSFRIHQDGTVSDIVIRRTSNNPQIDEAALEAAQDLAKARRRKLPVFFQRPYIEFLIEFSIGEKAVVRRPCMPPMKSHAAAQEDLPELFSTATGPQEPFIVPPAIQPN